MQTISEKPMCPSDRMTLRKTTTPVDGPDGRKYCAACAKYLGYLPHQNVDPEELLEPETDNGVLQALEILYGLYPAPNSYKFGERLDAIEDALGRPHSQGKPNERVAALKAEYGKRLWFSRARWRLAAQVD